MFTKVFSFATFKFNSLILKYLEKQDFKTILAGGDVVAACGYFKTRMYYVSTGGGSTLEYLEGKKFKTLKRLKGEKWKR